MDFKYETFENVIIYEFFMPLTNERLLRSALDDMFYKDTVIARLKNIPKLELDAYFPIANKENGGEYIERLCDWISKRFVGYSIDTVSGRLKAGALKTYSEAGNLLSKGHPYLIDETTAIVRFIFPVGSSMFEDSDFELQHSLKVDKENIYKEANQIKFLFKKLFVKKILEVVHAENEIWMLESGLRAKLHVWEKNRE